MVRPPMSDAPPSPTTSRRTPWRFVPSLYVLQGLNSTVVETAANVYFTALKLPLAQVGYYTSDLALPFTLKALWSPLVDLFGTKRGWLLTAAFVVAAAILFLAWGMQSRDPVTNVIFGCLAIAIAGATNDIAADGYYMLALDRRGQEFFVGVRSAAFRLGMIAISGGAVWMAGYLAGDSPEVERVKHAFAVTFFACGALYALVTLWHAVSLPRPEHDAPARGPSGGFASLRASIAEYVGKPGIAGVIAFILLFRVAETTLTPMIQPFLLGAPEQGGLGLSQQQVGLYNGTLGVSALILGGVGGGFWIARAGLRRVILPMTLAMHVPNLFFAWAAHARFGEVGAAVVVCVEKLGYGLGFSAYMAALLLISRGSRFATTHYAITTGLMAFSRWLSGRYSGVLVEEFGFERFFWLVSALGVLGLATLPFLPRDERSESERGAAG
jgi:PAT family beta-lactamase induction signal transducer AmpG